MAHRPEDRLSPAQRAARRANGQFGPVEHAEVFIDLNEPRVRPQWTIHDPAANAPGPWGLAMEVSRLFPEGSWSLVGGLMVQAHVLHSGIDIASRSTSDVDMVLHVETGSTTWLSASGLLTSHGFELRRPLETKGLPHRFVRGAGTSREQIVDVLVADHVAPSVLRDRGNHGRLVQAPGGTSALRKTVNLTVMDADGTESLMSTPDVLGALQLKAGAAIEDSRNPERHLLDAIRLLATIDDVDSILGVPERWTGRDPWRLRKLQDKLGPDSRHWLPFPGDVVSRSQRVLEQLADGPRRPSSRT